MALCLHGFPDSAYTWRHLLPALAEVGFHVVAPFLRGYAPTAVPDDAGDGLGALVADAVALHQALDGDGDAVLIGHDWGAEAADGAAAFAPDRWRRPVTLLGFLSPPCIRALFGDDQQLKRFFYLFWFLDSLPQGCRGGAGHGMAFLDRLWRDWSPGHRRGRGPCPGEGELAAAREPSGGDQLLPRPGECYRAWRHAVPYAAEEHAAWLLGAASRRCICMAAPTATSLCSRSVARSRCSRPARALTVVHGAGHFLHLEQPAEVNRHILAWVTG